MKKFVPLKYILGMIGLCFIIPVSSLIIMFLCDVEWNRVTIALAGALGFIIIGGPVVYFLNQENASIVIENNQLINLINDGTKNDGWTEEIQEIKGIKITSREEVKQYYENCRSKRVLLIDFGSDKIKYIAVGSFTYHQIARILKYIQNINPQIAVTRKTK